MAAPPALVLGAYATAPPDDDGGAFAALLLARGGAGCGLELPVHATGLLSGKAAEPDRRGSAPHAPATATGPAIG